MRPLLSLITAALLTIRLVHPAHAGPKVTVEKVTAVTTSPDAGVAPAAVVPDAGAAGAFLDPKPRGEASGVGRLVADGAAAGSSEHHFPPAIDPIEHPAQAYETAKDLKVELGITAAGLFVLMCIASAMASRAKPGSWLDKGRLPVILTAVAGDLAAVGGAMAGEITWTSALATVIVSIAGVVKLTGEKKPEA